MEIKVDNEMQKICENIINEKKTETEWALIESSDMFQTEHYCGGFDATENAFCFSYYKDNGEEYWFQITLKEADEIAKNILSSIKLKSL